MTEQAGGAAGQVHPRRLVGPRLDPLRLGRPAADRPRRQHDRPGGVPARPAGRGARGHAADERRQHPRPLRGALPRDLRRARRRRDAASAGAARPSPSRSTSTPAPRHVRAGERPPRRARPTTDGPILRTTSPGRSPSSFPRPSTSTRWSAVAEDLFVVARSRRPDLDAGDVLRPADRRDVPALRGAGDAED